MSPRRRRVNRHGLEFGNLENSQVRLLFRAVDTGISLDPVLGQYGVAEAAEILGEALSRTSS